MLLKVTIIKGWWVRWDICVGAHTQYIPAKQWKSVYARQEIIYILLLVLGIDSV